MTLSVRIRGAAKNWETRHGKRLYDALKGEVMKTQIDILADFIMANVDGEPSRSEGAGDCAIRIITELKAERDADMGAVEIDDIRYPIPMPVAELLKTVSEERDALTFPSE